MTTVTSPILKFNAGGDQARCIPCVAELSGASQQDGYVASCERCHTIARMDTMVVASFDSSLLMCQPCNHTYCWCAECRIVLRIQASVVISETRLCSGCAPAVRARTQLLQCSVCNMRLAAADFSSAETAQGSRRRCNTCVRPSSNQRAQSGDSLCIICAERERNVAYKSCWHLAACLQCAEKMSGCPVCRSKSTFVVLKLP
jgi:hypothetical protein